LQAPYICRLGLTSKNKTQESWTILLSSLSRTCFPLSYMNTWIFLSWGHQNTD